VLLLTAVSIVYDIVSPLVIGNLTEAIENESFTLPYLYTSVALYASILVVSLVCTYIQPSFSNGRVSASCRPSARICSDTLKACPTSSSTTFPWASW